MLLLGKKVIKWQKKYEKKKSLNLNAKKDAKDEQPSPESNRDLLQSKSMQN
jgi:hypothetical protein